MLRVLAMATALAVLAGAADAAVKPPVPVWQGEGFVTASTPACATIGIAAAGDYFLMVYRPKLVAADGPEALSFVGGRSAYLAVSQAASGKFQNSGGYLGTFISSQAIAGSSTGLFSVGVSPRAIVEGGGPVTISGTMTNFGGAGCTVSFRAAFTPRPD